MRSHRGILPLVRRLRDKLTRVGGPFLPLIRASRRIEHLLLRWTLAEQRTMQLRRLTKQLAQVEQRERRRLARVIHDDLQQVIAAAMLHVRGLRKSLPEDLIHTLSCVEEMLAQATRISRSLTSELCPPVEQSLCVSFQWLSQWMLDKYRLRVAVLLPREDVRLADPDLSTLLFQTVRELLFNVVKHAKVFEASVELSLDGHLLRVDVCDHGLGFETRALDGSEGCALGFGLFSIRERLELLGGRFKISSRPGKGTRASIWIPAEPAPRPREREDDAALIETS